MKTTKIKLIVAFEQNRGIGFKNEIPWFIAGELKWVGETTKKVEDSSKVNALIMGYNTWLSLPENRRPLAGRINIVISRTRTVDNEDVLTFRSLEEAIHWCKTTEIVESAFIFGGESVYRKSLEEDLVDEALITEVQMNCEVDTYFPELPKSLLLKHQETVTYGENDVVRKTYSKGL